MGRQKKIPSVNDTIMSLAQDSENKNYWNTKKLTNIPHQPKLFVSHRDGYLLDIIFTPKLIQFCYIILSRLTYKYTYIRVKNINFFPFSLPFHTLLFSSIIYLVSFLVKTTIVTPHHLLHWVKVSESLIQSWQYCLSHIIHRKISFFPFSLPPFCFSLPPPSFLHPFPPPQSQGSSKHASLLWTEDVWRSLFCTHSSTHSWKPWSSFILHIIEPSSWRL